MEVLSCRNNLTTLERPTSKSQPEHHTHRPRIASVEGLSCSRLEPRCADPLDMVDDSQHLALGGPPMSQEHSTPINPGEDAPPATNQPREEPTNPRFHSLCSEMGTCLPTPRGDTGAT
ncbi:hypothetical protein GW17_00060494 [Ensete ventricosum]|nr:hypothetical protein GW17_00060494 [Ensete ventricosum]